MATTSRPIDNIGVGIKSPITFKDGRMALTSESLVSVPGDSGIGPADEPQSMRLVLLPTLDDKRRVVFQAVRRQLLTRQGSRMMRGERGSLLDTLTFDENEPVVQSIAASYASLAVQIQEDRVSVISSEAGPDPEIPEAIRGKLNLRLRADDVSASVDYTVKG